MFVAHAFHDDRPVTDAAPDPADLILAVAGLESVLGRRAEARADYARAISLLSGRQRAVGDPDRRVAALVGLAAVAAASGDVLAASAAYREAVIAIAEAAATRHG